MRLDLKQVNHQMVVLNTRIKHSCTKCLNTKKEKSLHWSIENNNVPAAASAVEDSHLSLVLLAVQVDLAYEVGMA